MAEPLKNQYGPEIPKKLSESIARVYPAFLSTHFLDDVLKDYSKLELMPRGWHMARILKNYLPADYQKAANILIQSLGPKLTTTEHFGMAPFFYMPHAFFVAEYGRDDFETSLQALYEITQRFTAEFSIRVFIEKYPRQTLERLHKWTEDPSPHVRRLVSEGTRPRLPWAPRLRSFQKDPRPVLTLLEKLKDDPSLYVRRSVANNLNDIGKDNPELLYQTLKNWMKNAGSPHRIWIANHALRSRVKLGDPQALQLLGFKKSSNYRIMGARVFKSKVGTSPKAMIQCDLLNTGKQNNRFLVDFRIHYVKANGKTAPKVFKLKSLDLKSKESVFLSKTISLQEMTTRKHYSGRHKVDILVNGIINSIGYFDIETKKGKIG